jgi:Flp pilus assembly protein TadG
MFGQKLQTFFSVVSFLKRKLLFFKREDGKSLIEFAILAPVFITLVFGILNLGIMMTVQNALESAVREAGRYGITGQSEQGLTRDQSITQVIQQTASKYSASIIDPSKIQVTVTAYPDLTQTGQPGVSGSFGLPGQAVLYQVSYPWNTFFNLFWGSNIVTLHAQTPVLNEQFTPGS